MSIYKIFIVLFLCGVIVPLHAATLSECEKIKLQQLKAEYGSKTKVRKRTSSNHRGPSRSRQSVDKLDEWLWKNCGNYANELRSLEQSRM